jgi:4-hydroxybutyrate CoA-transferase
MDFMRGAVLSPGGKPIIAITATTRKGLSKIVPTLRPGAGVTTTRAHVHYVVTEYGVVNLFGKSLKERARALIQLAHPDHREALDREAHERFNGGWRS